MTTSSTFTSPSDIDLIVRYFIYRFCSSARKCLSDRYFKANIVYLVYSLLLLHIDVNIGRESASDTMYILLGYVHILNAVLYIWMWSEIRSVWDLYILPDWLNIFGSFLYWLSASQYNDQQPRSLLNIRRIELFASCVEVLATAGWCGQWYAEYFTDLATIPLSCVGRGFTLDDPDVWGMVTLVTATIYYFKYNAVMYFNLEEEAPSSLYVCGDCWYVANAFAYTLCAIRDNDGFWFMPSSGKPQDFLEIARAHYFSGGERDGDRGGTDRDGDGDGEVLKGEMSVGTGAGSGPGAVKVKTNGHGHGKKGHRDEDSGTERDRERERERGSSGKSSDHTGDSNVNGRSSGKGNHSHSGRGSGSAYVFVGSNTPGTPVSEDEGLGGIEREIDWERVRGTGGVGLESNIDKLSSIFLVSNAGSGSVNYRSSALSSNNNNNHNNNHNSNNNNNNGSNNIGSGSMSGKERGSVSGKDREREREGGSTISPKRDSISIFGTSSSNSTSNSNTRRNQ